VTAAAALDRRILSFIRRYALADRAPEAEFEALALDLFAYQFERNPFYRRLSIADGKEPGSVGSWKAVPAMPVAGFKELVLASFPKTKAVRVFRTSGTTSGARGAHFFDTLALYEAALLPAFRRHLLPDGASCRFFFLTASPEEAPYSSLSHMMGVVNRALSRPRGKFYVKKDDILFERLVEDLRADKKPVAVLTTAFALKAFLDRLTAARISFRLPRGSRLMETGGFKGRARAVSKRSLYAGVAKRLGIPAEFCVSEYGMTELSSQFYDAMAGRKGARFFRGPAWMRTLVVDPATGREARKGRPGLLRHCDLANRGSVAVVETEDLGRASESGFELLGRAPGAASRGCSLAYEALIRG